MPPVFQFQSVSKRFGPVVALDDVSFEVAPGTVCALLGANGAGKTTAIRILLGLEKPDAGTATVLGMDAQRKPMEIRQRVGYVPERPALYEWMTVEEIGWFASGFYSSGYLAEYEKCIARFGLESSKKIKTLSKGMRAKVALSLALAHRPELLILDEPTSGLDPLVRREFLESMVDVAAEGRTVLLSSHQVAEVERVADAVAILMNGKLAHVERLEDLKRGTSELLLTLPSELTRPPMIPGHVLAHIARRHEHLYLVRDLEEAKLRELIAQHGLPAPQLRHPGLEDILLAMLREYRHVGTGPPQYEGSNAPVMTAQTSSP